MTGPEISGWGRCRAGRNNCDTIPAMQITRRTALAGLGGMATAAAQSGKIQRLLYVTHKTGFSIHDIDNGHKHIRDIAVPDTADYKGISASISLGRLYLTSNLKDELVCIDLATDRILW